MHKMQHKRVLPQTQLFLYQLTSKEQNVQVAQGLCPRLLLSLTPLKMPRTDVEFDHRLLLFEGILLLVYNYVVVRSD